MGVPTTCTPPTASAYAIPDDQSINLEHQNHDNTSQGLDGIAMTTYPTAYPAVEEEPQPPVVTTSDFGGGTPMVHAIDDNGNDMMSGMNTGIPMHLQPKQGGTCCGFCCDFRRATIFVNSIIIGLSTFSLVSLFQRPSTEDTMASHEEMNDITDDVVLQDLAQIANDSYIASAILGGVLMVFTAVPLYGAYMFNVRMLSFGVVLLVATLVTEIILAYFYIEQADDVVASTGVIEFHQPIVAYTLTGIIQCLFIYPHVGLILEIRAGIMSFETYSREAYSCCCGVNNRPPPQHQQSSVPVANATNYYPTTTMNGQPAPSAAAAPPSNQAMTISF